MPAKPDPRKILDEAMQLEPTERAFVAETLIESLDLDEDFAISPEWRDEIRRRCADIDSKRTILIDSASVINELREKYTR
ncbi:MAG: hypothetical protein FD165_1996 [Gammaproteobacteria bacterium]|nr:MAG: hypothetical protein FD165_1996 [Gammaproteobacteria bacterium]TND04988.1 MAG: hypothetical protein FD120_1266 [Gammaproteobacteria bacterium]